ncbi:uncharacterized protein LOC111293622 isoform X2 [Durio zibethinus]|uniref:Uncharacterized protein LOC111293622 isoform X2 n=1 Tax=Durio zibethinus TaxID=66656 RepID=A0A6P5YQ02_DURZI|nr:uncharacterized protein LOC111293622 isoform X2 [Durio zibethinus]
MELGASPGHLRAEGRWGRPETFCVPNWRSLLRANLCPKRNLQRPSAEQVSFLDDDVRFRQLWRNRSAVAEAPSAVNQLTSAFASPAPSTKGWHFLVICCENKAIFLDLVTMRGLDVPKQELDNNSLLWAIEHPTYSALTRPLCNLSPLVPPQVVAPNKKLRCQYCRKLKSVN